MSETHTQPIPPVRVSFSEKFGEVAKSLATVQGQLLPLKKNLDVDAGKYSYSYADLAAMVALALPLLSKEQLAMVQLPSWDGKLVTVETWLLHPSEQWVRGILPMPVSGNGPQAIGSAITYAKRYSLGAMLGVTSEGEDDDGQRAQGNGGQRQQEQGPPQAKLNQLKGLAKKKIKQAKDLDTLTQVAAWIKRQPQQVRDDQDLRQLYGTKEGELSGAGDQTPKDPRPCRACGAEEGANHADQCPEDPNPETASQDTAPPPEDVPPPTDKDEPLPAEEAPE